MFSIKFIKEAFKLGEPDSQTDIERLEKAKRLEEARLEAIKYLGNKWLLHPDNFKQKK